MDLLIDNKVIVEVKCAEEIITIHRAQLLNYLKATGLNVGLIINFGQTKVQFERMVNKPR
jgi:GxxExxY protein